MTPTEIENIKNVMFSDRILLANGLLALIRENEADIAEMADQYDINVLKRRNERYKKLAEIIAAD